MAVSEVTSGMSLRGKERGRLIRQEQHKRWRANRIGPPVKTQISAPTWKHFCSCFCGTMSCPSIRYLSVILLAVPSIKIIENGSPAPARRRIKAAGKGGQNQQQ